MIMNKHLSITLLALATLLLASPSRADMGWANPPTATYPDPNTWLSSPYCAHSCCYPSWLYESGYIWHSQTPPQPGDNRNQGDWSYDGWCTQSFIDEMWHEDNWDFDYEDWDEGSGADINPCDRRFPLARMMVALYVFKNSWGPTTPNDELGLILKNAYGWAKGQTDEVDSGCDDDGNTAVFYRDEWGDEETVFYWKFFYDSTVSSRAMIILHEARHVPGCRHNAMHLGTSHDQAWNNGCDWKSIFGRDGMAELPADAGANQYAAMWGWAFYRYGQNTTPAVRARALDEVNTTLVQTYAELPCFRVGTDGEAYLVPHHLCTWTVPPKQNQFGYLTSQAHLPPTNGPYGYVAHDPNWTSPPYPPFPVSYDAAPWTTGSDFDWALRAVDIDPGQRFDKVGSYQIYTTYYGQDYCLQPSQPPYATQSYLWVDGSSAPSGVACETLGILTGLEAVPCTSPTSGAPQSRTWFQVTPLAGDFWGYFVTWNIAHIRPTLRCWNLDDHPLTWRPNDGNYHFTTLNDQFCLTTINGFAGIYPCADLQGQSFDIGGWLL